MSGAFAPPERVTIRYSGLGPSPTRTCYGCGHDLIPVIQDICWCPMCGSLIEAGNNIRVPILGRLGLKAIQKFAK